MKYIAVFLLFISICSCDRVVCIKCIDNIDYKAYQELGIDEKIIKNICSGYKNDVKLNSDHRLCIRYNSLTKKLK